MDLQIKEDEPLALHTIFRIGGPARFFVDAKAADEVRDAILFAREKGLPWFMLGAGSNVLVSNRGFNGVLVHWAGGSIHFEGNTIVVDAAVSMARAVAESVKAGLRGFEWAIGVPGSIGGSVRGNAGCFGGEMKDVVRSIRVYDSERDHTEEWENKKADFGYRNSIFKRRPELVVFSVELLLEPGDRSEGEQLVREYTLHRTKSQDIGTSSAGCIFKNIPWSRRDVDKETLMKRFPELERFRSSPGISTGYLVDRAGLKGTRIGGALISERHGNFIINAGKATAEDVVILIGMAKEYVHRKYGLLLEEEIQYVGFL